MASSSIPPTGLGESLSIPPTGLGHSIGIVCNGELEFYPGLVERIQSCQAIIGVDGGLNYCKRLHIYPQWIVGDFDSVDPAILEELRQNCDLISLSRAKNCSDLEAAIEKSKEISTQAQIVIWAGLGGRLDHTLSNLFLLFRHPTKLFLESEKQLLFALDASHGEVEISHTSYKTLALYPLNGSAAQLSGNVTLPLLEKGRVFVTSLPEKWSFRIGTGEVLVILDQRTLSPPVDLPCTAMSTSFLLEQPLIQTLSYLAHQSLHPREVKLSSKQETIYNIQPNLGKLTFASKRGQTISLIPFHGPAKGIKSEGLKWELGGAFDTLDKNFVGISNVALGESFTLSVGSGELLCIVNDKLIDEDIISL